ncbi:alpha/beta hydrolase [Streptomyces avicenniae]|uniref:alpha/beta hydrolase n=1 Tax=Streptomyces avicenniae TaxID=500153 RepID=UPI000AF23419|nr:alpha/beta hydrolase [Streptomyces avicenniae]
MRRARLVAPSCLALAALLTTAACGGGTGGADPGSLRPAADGRATDTSDLPDSLTGQRLDWSACPSTDPAQGPETSPTPLPDGAAWECATLTAPLDYTDPEGDTIDLAMIRARTDAKGERRLGSLLFNFGGPGGSGVATLPAFGRDYAELNKRYDLVSFDPRGVGDSEGVQCLDDRGLDAFFAADADPRTARERREFTDRLKDFARGCEERSGDLLPHLTTTATARDMDLMREVLGDRKLHYFGISYGTELGGVYAHLFPRRVGRALLDAVVDPTGDSEQGALGQARGFQLALGSYLDHCTQDDDCPLGGDKDEAEDRLGRFLDRLRDHPLRTQDPEGRELTQSLAWNGIAQSLYSEDFWPYLTQGLDDALSGDARDGTVLLSLGDSMNGRNPDGTYSTLQSSLTAINCADSKARYSVDHVRDRLDQFEDASAVFGPPMAWGMLSCTYWPVRGRHDHPDVEAKGSAPILLIGTTGDPATPFEGTEHMKDALGDDVAVELTYEGEGHGAYNSGNDCVRDKANAYLLDGRVPDDGTTCEA